MRDRGSIHQGGVRRPRVRGAARPPLRALDWLLQRLVPPKRNRVCFASIPDLADSAYAMFRFLLANRSGLELLWFVRDRECGARLRAQLDAAGPSPVGNVVRVRRWRGPWAYVAFLRSRYVFHTHGAFSFSRPARGRVVVSLWHGMPVKAIRLLHSGDDGGHAVHGDVHVATSRFFRYVIAAAFDVPVEKVLLSGLPRCDVLKGFLQPEQSRSSVLSAVGLDEAEPVILWLPTHREDGTPTEGESTSNFVDELAPELLAGLVEAVERHGCQLLLKLHPFDSLNDGAVPERLRHPRIRIMTSPEWQTMDVQLYDLVACADALLTDVSSVAIDFLHTGRPVASLGFDETRYGRDLVLPHAVLTGGTGITDISTVEDLDRFVATVGSPVDHAPGPVAALLNEDDDLCSSERIAAELGI